MIIDSDYVNSVSAFI